MSHITPAHGVQLGDAVLAHARTCVRCWTFHRMCPDAERLVRRAAKVATVLREQLDIKLAAPFLPCTLCTGWASGTLWCPPPCTFLLPLCDECRALPLTERPAVLVRFAILHDASCVSRSVMVAGR